ncbi:50S ribosomal protein L37ae [Candidatus Woesearchaeota archaeon]|nr:50S ribosomal protein L37ae [Candidatus Woesearchaeota archaeon]
MAGKEKTIKIGSIKKFGTRYGRTTKERFGIIELQQKTSYKCPHCHYSALKRLAMGIWQCYKCSAKFAGKAYTIGKKTVKLSEEQLKELEVVPEAVEEQKPEEEEFEEEQSVKY